MDITIYHDPTNIEKHIRKCKRLNKGVFAEPDKSQGVYFTDRSYMEHNQQHLDGHQVHNPFMDGSAPNDIDLALPLYKVYIQYQINQARQGSARHCVKRMMNDLVVHEIPLVFLCPCEYDFRSKEARCHSQILKEVLLEWYHRYLKKQEIDEEARDLLNIYNRLYPLKRQKQCKKCKKK